MTTRCTAQYQRPGGREPGDRAVDCHLPAGHLGAHQEADTEFAWNDPPAENRHKARVLALQAANDAALQELAQQGIQIDQSAITATRLAVLTEFLLGDMDDPRRLRYEYRVQDRFSALIREVRGQVARARLLQGVNGVVPPTLNPDHGQ